MVTGFPGVWAFVPGLLLIGLGLGLMLTPSVNVVQSAFPEERQGEISGLSRSVSNLGSSLGTAIAGTILVAGITKTPERAYGLAMVVLAVVGLVGLLASALLPRTLPQSTPPRPGHDQRPHEGTHPTTRSVAWGRPESQHRPGKAAQLRKASR